MTKARVFVLGWLVAGVLVAASGAASRPVEPAVESGTLSVYFMGEKVGYEDYAWRADDQGYVLQASGRMTKPLGLEIESMTLSLNRDFIPLEYSFRGTLNGTRQDITTRFKDGKASNTVSIGGQDVSSATEVRRDALILPNPIYSTYIVLAKRFGCGVKDKVEVSAYIVPQVEVPGTVQSDPANPCLLDMNESGVQIVLETDAEHHLISVTIPSQNIRVTNNQ